MLIRKLRSRSGLGRRRKADETGFTLVELLVVITILGILAAVVIAAVSGIGDKGEASAKKTDISILQTAAEASCAVRSYYADSPEMRRDGFLSSIGEYNDIDIDPVQGGPQCTKSDGTITRYAVWTPKKTTYPVTITGCNGNAITYPAKPNRVYATELGSYEVMLRLGLGDRTYVRQFTRDQVVSQPADVQALAAPFATSRTLANPASGFFGGSAAYLTANNLDMMYTVVPFFLQAGPADPAAPYTELDMNRTDGIETYVAFNGPIVSGVGCTNVPKDANGNKLPYDTYEAMFDDIRNIGTIFDVQEEAMELIASTKSRISDALLKASGAIGDRSVKVGVINGNSLINAYGGTALDAPGNEAYGNTGINAGITSAGGTNAFRDRLVPVPPTTDPLTKAQLIAAAPDLLVLLHYDADPTATNALGDCSDLITRLRADTTGWATIPAVNKANNKGFVCLSWYAFAGNPPGGVAKSIELIADAIATA